MVELILAYMLLGGDIHLAYFNANYFFCSDNGVVYTFEERDKDYDAPDLNSDIVYLPSYGCEYVGVVEKVKEK